MTGTDKMCSAGKQKKAVPEESILIKHPKDYCDFKERDASKRSKGKL